MTRYFYRASLLVLIGAEENSGSGNSYTQKYVGDYRQASRFTDMRMIQKNAGRRER